MITTYITQTEITKKTLCTLAIATAFLLHGTLYTRTPSEPVEANPETWSPSPTLPDPYFSLFVDMAAGFNLLVESPDARQSFVDLVYLVANRCSPEQKNKLVAILADKDRAATYFNPPKESAPLNSKISEVLFNDLITYLQKSTTFPIQAKEQSSMHTISTSIAMPKNNPLFPIIADFVTVKGNQDQINKFRALFNPEQQITPQLGSINSPKSPEPTSDFDNILIMLKNFDSESASGRSVDKFVKLANSIKSTLNPNQRSMIDVIVSDKQKEAYRSTKQKTDEPRNALSDQLFTTIMDHFNKGYSNQLYKEILNFIDENGTEEQATLFKNISKYTPSKADIKPQIIQKTALISQTSMEQERPLTQQDRTLIKNIQAEIITIGRVAEQKRLGIERTLEIAYALKNRAKETTLSNGESIDKHMDLNLVRRLTDIIQTLETTKSENTGKQDAITFNALPDPYFPLFVTLITNFDLGAEPPVVYQSFVDLVYLIANKCSPEQKNNLNDVLGNRIRAAYASHTPKKTAPKDSKISEVLFNNLISYLQKSSTLALPTQKSGAYTISTSMTKPENNPLYRTITDFVEVRGNKDQINKLRALFKYEQPVTQSNRTKQQASKKTK